MERESYTVMENVGDDGLGVSVCATVVEAGFDFTVFVIPRDDTAQGIITQCGAGL